MSNIADRLYNLQYKLDAVVEHKHGLYQYSEDDMIRLELYDLEDVEQSLIDQIKQIKQYAGWH